VTSTVDWPSAFLAVSALVGEPLDASIDVLGAAATADSSALASALRSTSREARARAMARVVTAVVAELDVEAA
jgi:hypothetical protein